MSLRTKKKITNIVAYESKTTPHKMRTNRRKPGFFCPSPSDKSRGDDAVVYKLLIMFYLTNIDRYLFMLRSHSNNTRHFFGT